MAGQSTSPASGSHGYFYSVRAVDAVGNQSAASDPLQVVMDAAPPTTPVAPTGASPVGSAPSISFTATIDPLAGGVSSGVDHYDVYRDGSKVNQTAIPAAGPLTWTDNASQSSSPVSGSGSYAYTVVAVDAAGNPSAHRPRARSRSTRMPRIPRRRRAVPRPWPRRLRSRSPRRSIRRWAVCPRVSITTTSTATGVRQRSTSIRLRRADR